MIKIRHRDTGALLLEIDADTLAGAELSNEVLRGADLRGADLSEIAWHNTFVVNTALDDATLAAANLRRATLIAISLRGASLAEADLTGALLLGVNLTRTNLSGACFAETFIADCRTLSHRALALQGRRSTASRPFILS